MTERIADREERLRAIDPAESFIVQAPAGSGKTELLIQRFLTLLGTVDQPESIVAITFTKKAAGEMRHRVVGALQRAASEPSPDKEHERRTWDLAKRVLDRDRQHTWELIQQPSRLRIQTIDSLCGTLVRQMPWLSRMGAPASPEDHADYLYRAAASATLDLLEGEDAGRASALERVLQHLDNNVGSVSTLLVGMLRRRDHWLRHVVPNAPSAGFRERLRVSFHRIITAELEQVCRLFPQDFTADLLELARFAAGNLADQGESPLARCGDLREMPGSEPSDLDVWLGLTDMLLTKDGARRKVLDKRSGFPATPAGRAAKERCLSIALSSGLVDRMQALRSLPPGDFSESQWEVLGALLELLPVAVAQLKLVFRQEGKVDFTEIAQASRTALGTADVPTDLAFALDCRIQHLLVDEFQDTSYGQYELLEKLTEGWEDGDGRTIFLVGDPMQSIYAFREAEVGLFLRARAEGIGRIGLTPLTLSVNFRSNAGIVDWVNSALGAAFPNEEDMFKGAVTYAPCVAIDDSGGDDAVRVHPFFDKLPEEEAEKILEVIREAQRETPEGSIAVLVRSRSHLTAIIKTLQRAGQNYRAVEIDALAERPVVQDLLALTGALLHSGDRPAWLAVLRAPWCGLTLADLHALIAGDFSSAVWDLIRDTPRAEPLSVDGQARLDRIRPVLSTALAQRGRIPLRRWVEATWIALGGPACLDNRTGIEDACAYLDLLEDSVAGADLQDAERFREDVAGLFARPDVEAKATLQLLTVHKAKGLEFDTVIVPGLGRPTRPEEPRLLLWLEYIDRRNETQLLLAPIKETGTDSDPTYAYLRKIHAVKADHESTRLLYVAATRARKRLHLLGHASIHPETGELKAPDSRTLLSKIWAAVGQGFERAAAAGASPVAPVVAPVTVGDALPEPLGIPLRRLSTEWRSVSPPPDAEWRPQFPEFVSDSDALARTNISFEWASELQRRVGIVVHALLQRLDPDRPEWNPGTVESALMAQGLTGEKLQEAMRRVEAALRATVADPRGQWILARHEEDRREYELSGVVAGRLRHFALDRTFVDESGIRWIVDYKTGIREGGDLEGFLDNEQVRYREQLEGYARIVGRLDSRPIRLGLYFPMLSAWREWKFESSQA